ncbi:MAG: ABC transporter ATP-binding protein [Peptococcaceae bacterium]|jgi:putative ABC transport system ATP-binding protein|nr:ABC transporter ATP-binding protein [Peptococcaceae bacterium]
MAVLEVKDLCKVYGEGDTAVHAVDHVSFEVEKGEFVAIVGASGSGKSTLMNLIGGIDRPTGGKVMIDGEDLYALSESERAIFRRRNIGMIFQFYNLIPTLTAEENIMLPFLLDKRRPEKAKVKELLALLGLEARATHLPSALSGGQQQRVSIGRALINDPAFILADEPTGNLDSQSGREVMALLQMANRKYHQTVLLITHDERIALSADRILTIGDGKLLRDEVLKGGE